MLPAQREDAETPLQRGRFSGGIGTVLLSIQLMSGSKVRRALTGMVYNAFGFGFDGGQFSKIVRRTSSRIPSSSVSTSLCCDVSQSLG